MNRTQAPFLQNHQEVYDGRAALSADPDFDKIVTADENACGTNPNHTDGDGILDRFEFRACANRDGDAKQDAYDTDSDNDGITDGLEDKNKNGLFDPGETDALAVDTDGGAPEIISDQAAWTAGTCGWFSAPSSISRPISVSFTISRPCFARSIETRLSSSNPLASRPPRM